jgi:hypothetical protein
MQDEAHRGAEHKDGHAIIQIAVIAASDCDKQAEGDGYCDTNYRSEHSPFLFLGRIPLGAPLVFISNAKPWPSGSFGLSLLQI